MILYDFNKLDDHNKYDIVFTQGQFVDTVTEGATKYALYSISKFWIEVEYYAHSNKIKGIYSFISGEKLNRHSSFPKNI